MMSLCIMDVGNARFAKLEVEGTHCIDVMPWRDASYATSSEQSHPLASREYLPITNLMIGANLAAPSRQPSGFWRLQSFTPNHMSPTYVLRPFALFCRPNDPLLLSIQDSHPHELSPKTRTRLRSGQQSLICSLPISIAESPSQRSQCCRESTCRAKRSTSPPCLVDYFPTSRLISPISTALVLKAALSSGRS